MRSARQLSNAILVERHAERGLLPYVDGFNKAYIALNNNLPVKCDVIDKEGNIIELHVNNFNDKAWKKYTKQRSVPLEMGILTNNFIPVVCDMAKWFLSGGYSERYTYAKSRSARKFVLTSCYLLLASYFMRYKLSSHEFVDDWAQYRMSIINNTNQFAEEMHRATGHALKHNEDLPEKQEQIYLRYLNIAIGYNYVPYEPLPPLPVGVPDPLAIPEEVEDGE